MSKKHLRREGNAPSEEAKAPAAAESSPAVARVRAFLGELVAGALFGPLMKLIAAFVLGGAGIFLTAAWQSGPMQLVDKATYAKFTIHPQARIVESWVAVQWNPERMKDSLNWRTRTKANQCMVVEYSGEWGAPMRRAFCGYGFMFNEAYTLHDVNEVVPGVPFAWSRDASGFIAPEIRVSPALHEWLASHPPRSTFALRKPYPATALEELQRTLDRPVEEAIAGWAMPAPLIELALDPQQPAQALPASYVAQRMQQGSNWLAFVIAAGAGLMLWFFGMNLMLGNLPRLAIIFIGVLPLCALPWWGAEFPHYLRSLNADLGSVFTEILDQLNGLGSITASEPADATLSDGDRLTFRVEDTLYRDTFGRLRFTLPQPAPKTGDEALAALASATTMQVRALADADKSALFANLKRDKERDLSGAGLVFLPAAREAILDPQGDPAVQRSAERFLDAWLTQPVATPDPRLPGYRQRVRLFHDLADIPVPYIANAAAEYVEAPTKK